MADLSDRPVRLLALDVDGTLLDQSGVLRAGIQEVLQSVSDRGIRAVLCTGRRYRRAAAISRQIGLGSPMVCNSGALVKDPVTQQTLWRADLDPQVMAGVLDHFQTSGYPAVSFSDLGLDSYDFFVAAYPSGRPDFDDYVGQNFKHAQVEPGWQHQARVGATSHFHVCAIGSHQEILELEQGFPNEIRPRIQTFVQRTPRYVGWMCEVIRADASKWTAVCQVADRWGIPRSQICAVGDDVNDRAMIEQAGLGVAMAHAPASVRSIANLVLGDTRPDELASFLDSLRAG